MNNTDEKNQATEECLEDTQTAHEQTENVIIEEETCTLCNDSAQCVTVCKHFFCYTCARGFITQSTKCVVCSEETNGIVFITVNESRNKQNKKK
ncbi:hypothetical protein NEIG_00668 [Nematocida sp. ERTm5]|nr:hypothetical protein NEIG_00668 [Nematocida sp. ERTm5]